MKKSILKKLLTFVLLIGFIIPLLYSVKAQASANMITGSDVSQLNGRVFNIVSAVNSTSHLDMSPSNLRIGIWSPANVAQQQWRMTLEAGTTNQFRIESMHANARGRFLSGAVNGNVTMETTRNNNSLWTVTADHAIDGVYRITNVATNRVLNLNNGTTANGTIVSAQASDGQRNQQWLFRPTTPATSTVTGRITRANGGQSVANARIEILQSGNVISSATSNAQGSFTMPVIVANNLTIRVTANGFRGQSRNFTATSGANVQNFALEIDSQFDGGRFFILNPFTATVVDLAGGNRLIGWIDLHRRANQLWDFTFVPENNAYLIRSVSNGRLLYDNGRASGIVSGHNQLAVGNGTGTAAQWRVIRTNNIVSPYSIVNVHTGRALDMATVHGANTEYWLGTYPLHEGARQRFAIVRN